MFSDRETDTGMSVDDSSKRTDEFRRRAVFGQEAMQFRSPYRQRGKTTK